MSQSSSTGFFVPTLLAFTFLIASFQRYLSLGSDRQHPAEFSKSQSLDDLASSGIFEIISLNSVTGHQSFPIPFEIETLVGGPPLLVLFQLSLMERTESSSPLMSMRSSLNASVNRTCRNSLNRDENIIAI